MTVQDKNNIPRLIKELQDAKVRALREIGVEGEGEIKDTLTNSRPEWSPLKPATITKKGSSRPLIDDGIMRASVTSKVDEENSLVRIGLFGNYIEKEGKDDDRTAPENVVIGLIHEFGAPRANIPQRAFMRPTFDEKIEPGALEIITREYDKAIKRAGL